MNLRIPKTVLSQPQPHRPLVRFWAATRYWFWRSLGGKASGKGSSKVRFSLHFEYYTVEEDLKYSTRFWLGLETYTKIPPPAGNPWVSCMSFGRGVHQYYRKVYVVRWARVLYDPDMFVQVPHSHGLIQDWQEAHSIINPHLS